MPSGNISAQQMKYYEMINQGMPAQQAFNIAFPEGLDPNRIQKEAANDQQKAALGQILGTVAGGVGTAYLTGAIGGGTTAATTGSALGGALAGGSGGAGAGAVGAGAGGYTLGTEAAIAKLGAGSVGAGGVGAGAGGLGATTTGTTTATTGLGSSAAALATNPVTLAILAAVAGGINYNRNRQKYKAMGAGEGFRNAAKDPINWIIPGGLWGAMFGNKDRYLTEDIRLRKLQKQGYDIPESALTKLEHGRSMEELVKLEQNKQAQGQFGNTKFAQSRNEADLTPLDIQGYANIFEKAGKDKAGDANYRMELARRALEANAVNEHHGTINVDWSKVNLDKLGTYQGPSEKDFAKDPNLDWRKWRKPTQTVKK